MLPKLLDRLKNDNEKIYICADDWVNASNSCNAYNDGHRENISKRSPADIDGDDMCTYGNHDTLGTCFACEIKK